MPARAAHALAARVRRCCSDELRPKHHATDKAGPGAAPPQRLQAAREVAVRSVLRMLPVAPRSGPKGSLGRQPWHHRGRRRVRLTQSRSARAQHRHGARKVRLPQSRQAAHRLQRSQAPAARPCQQARPRWLAGPCASRRAAAHGSRGGTSQTRFGWEPIVEKDFIIGAKLDGQSVTLEPGGQFELSGAHLREPHSTCASHAVACRRAGRDAAHDVR